MYLHKVLLLWLSVYCLWNLFAFFLVRKDKQRARQRGWRVPERTFFQVSFLFGAVGVWLGMYVFRHKTQHLSFTLGVPALVLFNFMCGYWLLVLHLS